MKSEAEIILPDVTTYSKAPVIKITRYGIRIDIDKSSMMFQWLFFPDCFCHSKKIYMGTFQLSSFPWKMGRSWAQILFWSHAVWRAHRCLSLPHPRLPDQDGHPDRHRPARRENRLEHPRSARTQKRKMPAYCWEKLWFLRIFCRCFLLCVKEPSAARNQQSPVGTQPQVRGPGHSWEAPPWAFRRFLWPVATYVLLNNAFFSTWALKEGFIGASPKDDRAGGDSVGDGWWSEGGQGTPARLRQGRRASLPSDSHLPEVPRANATASLIVSIGGNAALHNFRKQICAFFGSTCPAPACVRTPLAHTGALSSSPLRDTGPWVSPWMSWGALGAWALSPSPESSLPHLQLSQLFEQNFPSGTVMCAEATRTASERACPVCS